MDFTYDLNGNTLTKSGESSSFLWGFIVVVFLEDGTQQGYVFNLEGDCYRWRLEDDVYYVLIDGEWVPMPEGWKPGDPLPPQNAT